LQRGERRGRPDPPRCAEERPSLNPAGTIRHGVEQKGIRERVERLQLLRRSVGVVHQRQRGVARLLDGRLEERAERIEIVHLTLLPRRLEAPRVCKRTRRERGVDDLPGEPIRHFQNKKYRCASGSTSAGFARSSSPSAVTI